MRGFVDEELDIGQPVSNGNASYYAGKYQGRPGTMWQYAQGEYRDNQHRIAKKQVALRFGKIRL